MELIPEAIEAYAKAHATPESALLARLVEETHRDTDAPNMQTGHIEGSLLRMLVKLSGAKRALEIGTFTGYSGLCIAEGLPEDGELITCDRDPETTAIAQRYWAESPHGKKIELRLGNALDTVAALDGAFDFAFIDADKENYVSYWNAIVPKMRPGGLICVDNVLWSGKILAPEAPADKAIAALNDAVAGDARVEAVLLTVRDGLTLARVKSQP